MNNKKLEVMRNQSKNDVQLARSQEYIKNLLFKWHHKKASDQTKKMKQTYYSSLLSLQAKKDRKLSPDERKKLYSKISNKFSDNNQRKFKPKNLFPKIINFRENRKIRKIANERINYINNYEAALEKRNFSLANYYHKLLDQSILKNKKLSKNTKNHYKKSIDSNEKTFLYDFDEDKLKIRYKNRKGQKSL